MKIVVVPDALRLELEGRIDAALPADAGPDDRRAAYLALLDFYDKHGRIPEFSFERRKP